MSGKKTTLKARPMTNPKMDRRARRTRDALGDALIHLMQERPFNSITVQDVLARAEVGRSTFYTHYRDKNDLFLSDAEEFWEAASTMIERSGEESKRVAPVRELFTHVAEAKLFRDALVASGKVHDVMELGQGHFARAIELGTTNGKVYFDYAMMARSMGMHGEGPINDPKDVLPALKRAVATVKRGEPALVDIVSQPR